MSVGAFDAASAYGRVLGAGSGLKPAAPAAATAGEEPQFGAMVENLVTSAAQTMQAAETASAKQVVGKGDLIDVVTAIGAAETALDTLVAVRDKMVSAYTDIMRMQI